jgi:acyl carrier protein
LRKRIPGGEDMRTLNALKPRIFLCVPATPSEFELNITQAIVRILDECLNLNGRSAAFSRDTPLLGALPELDSMAVLSLITALEDQFGLVVDDDDLNGATFATVGALSDFVRDKLTV